MVRWYQTHNYNSGDYWGLTVNGVDYLSVVHNIFQIPSVA